jgi:3-isopropylmalate dehydrogenase
MTRIAVIPGDGIGREVVPVALDVLEALGLDIEFDVLEQVNADTYLRTGVALSPDDFRRAQGSAAILLGAIGDPRVQDTNYGRGILLRLRFELDLYVNYRPAKLAHERLSPLRDPERRGIDCLIVRENTEGLYAGIGGRLRAETDLEVAIDAEIGTSHGVSRIVDFAFSIARTSVCLVDKSNAVPNNGGLWQRYWRDAQKRHPQLRTCHEYVDAAAMKLVADPTAFDVIVTNNSYGDILSDLASQLAGGIGLACSANINPGSGHGLFEPVHGSAPDIADKGVANPIATILTTALMLDQLSHREPAQAIRNAVYKAIERGRVTRDLGGTLSMKEAAAAIRAEL